MKKIVIGRARSGKTYKKVLPEILKHEGPILFISVKDEVTYLKLENIFQTVPIHETDDIIKVEELIRSGENVFAQCEIEKACSLLCSLWFRTLILMNEKILFIIDEGDYILSSMDHWFLLDLSRSNANTLITFQSNRYLEKLLRNKQIFKTEEGKLQFIEKWEIENMDGDYLKVVRKKRTELVNH